MGGEITKTFHVPTYFLIICSTYLEDKIKAGGQEMKDALTLDGVSPTAFTELLDFLYGPGDDFDMHECAYETCVGLGLITWQWNIPRLLEAVLEELEEIISHAHISFYELTDLTVDLWDNAEEGGTPIHEYLTMRFVEFSIDDPESDDIVASMTRFMAGRDGKTAGLRGKGYYKALRQLMAQDISGEVHTINPIPAAEYMP